MLEWECDREWSEQFQLNYIGCKLWYPLDNHIHNRKILSRSSFLRTTEAVTSLRNNRNESVFENAAAALNFEWMEM